MTPKQIRRLVQELRDDGAMEVEISPDGSVKVKFAPKTVEISVNPPPVQYVPVPQPYLVWPEPRRYRYPEIWMGGRTGDVDYLPRDSQTADPVWMTYGAKLTT